jgi:hypothetical protein
MVKPPKRSHKSAGGGRKDESGTVNKKNHDKDGSNKTDPDKKKKSSKQQRRFSPSSPSDNNDLPAAMMCIPASTNDQQQRASTNDSSNVAMLIDLSRRQMAMRQASGAGAAAGGFGGNQKGGGGGGSTLANYAGTAADSFAQSFVDRWAGKMGGLGADMPSLASHSPMRGGNTMLSSLQQQHMQQQGGGRGMSESDYRMMTMMMEYTNNGGQQQQQQQKGWRVCNYCQNTLFMSPFELQSHEINCREMYNSFGGFGGGVGGGGGGLSMLSSYGNRINPMQQQQMKQMHTPFLGCLPIGTSIASAATGMAGGMNSDGLQRGGVGGSGEMTVPRLPAFSMPLPSYADTDPANSKQRKEPKRKAPLRKEDDPEIIENSKGPFKTLDEPILLALDGDDCWLTPLHCYVRKHCVEVFTATADDTFTTPTKGKRRTISEGQIGIRCPHCNKDGVSIVLDKKDGASSRGSIYYPNSIGNVYNATMNLLQRHLFFCPKMPPEILKKYSSLKKDDARSGTSKMYWIESAKCLGFVDTLHGIKLSAKPPPPPPVPDTSLQKNETAAARKRTRELLSSKEGTKGDAKDDGTEVSCNDVEEDASPVVLPDDDRFTKFSFLLMSQMRRCVFTEADRLGKRKGLPNGFAGIACRHCFGGFGAGRFFPSSIKTLSDTSKTLDVIFAHFERCREVPKSVMDEIAKAKISHEAERANLKFGSQKGECLPVPVVSTFHSELHSLAELCF